ncbi:hypothetical protein BLA29_008983, partial [Euroglyphus maynei]
MIITTTVGSTDAGGRRRRRRQRQKPMAETISEKIVELSLNDQAEKPKKIIFERKLRKPDGKELIEMQDVTGETAIIIDEEIIESSTKQDDDVMAKKPKKMMILKRTLRKFDGSEEIVEQFIPVQQTNDLKETRTKQPDITFESDDSKSIEQKEKFVEKIIGTTIDDGYGIPKDNEKKPDEHLVVNETGKPKKISRKTRKPDDKQESREEIDLKDKKKIILKKPKPAELVQETKPDVSI